MARPHCGNLLSGRPRPRRTLAVNEDKRQSLNTFREMLSSPNLAVIGLVVLTILSALTLLKLRYDARVHDVDRQYARSSAHAGRQL